MVISGGIATYNGSIFYRDHLRIETAILPVLYPEPWGY